MTGKSKRLFIKKCLVIVIAVIAVHVNLFSYVWCNKSESAFGSDGTSSGRVTESSVGQLVAEGAGHILKAHANTLLFLAQVEWIDIDGVDYEKMKGLINAADSAMGHAKGTWNNLVMTTEDIPYNLVTINKLHAFDYNSFKKEHVNTLNKIAFTVVSKYLKKGDIRGLYKRLLMDIDDLIIQVEMIQRTIESNNMPPLESLWHLNQSFSHTILCGQYVAEIFYAVSVE